jgi:hypothetical protein
MPKKEKKPKDLIIQEVIEDLKLETGSSIRVTEKKPSVIGDAFLNFEAEKSRVTGMLPGIDLSDEKSKPQFPLGQNSDDQHEKTTLLPPDENQDVNADILLSEAANAPKAPKAPPVKLDEAPKFELPKFEAPKPLLIPKEAPLAPVFPNSGDKFQQAETLKIAQIKIIDLEKEVESLRRENIILSSASEMAKHQSEDFRMKIQSLERAHFELKENGESELKIFKDGLLKKDTEIHRLRSKIDELENRLSNDLKKVRVRERELENRLELARMEKNALVRAKDENILDLKRRNEVLDSEIEKFQQTVLDLNEKIEGNQEQFSRTVRALRIALTNLEVNENTSSITLAPIKKAE